MPKHILFKLRVRLLVDDEAVDDNWHLLFKVMSRSSLCLYKARQDELLILQILAL